MTLHKSEMSVASWNFHCYNSRKNISKAKKVESQRELCTEKDIVATIVLGLLCNSDCRAAERGAGGAICPRVS